MSLFCDLCINKLYPWKKDGCGKCVYADLKIDEILTNQGGGKRKEDKNSPTIIIQSMHYIPL